MSICNECNKEIKDADGSCPSCGAAQNPELPPEYIEDKEQETSSKNEVVLLAKRAMSGDDSVWGEIYEKTHRVGRRYRMFCYNCGKQISEDTGFCTSCGVMQKTHSSSVHTPAVPGVEFVMQM